MREVKTNVYTFLELSDKAKEVAIERLNNINTDCDWYCFTYEHAKNIGLEITSFDLNWNKHAKGKFIIEALDVCKKILDEHGKNFGTYSIAEKYILEYNLCPDDIDLLFNLEESFKKELLNFYADMLQVECNYLRSNVAIIETIIANSYEFTDIGKLF